MPSLVEFWPPWSGLCFLFIFFFQKENPGQFFLLVIAASISRDKERESREESGRAKATLDLRRAGP